MRTVDRIRMRAPLARVLQAAVEVEAWPALLSHYRWVRMLERRAEGEGGVVEMAAWRRFGPIKYPAWWVSEMWVDRAHGEIRYRHIRGVTRGMAVVWRLRAADSGTAVELVHEWNGPSWPLIRRPAAEWVIGPVFVHGIAARTLAGLKRYVEQNHG